MPIFQFIKQWYIDMEFLHEIKLSIPVNVDELQNLISIKRLPELCSSISSVIKNKGAEAIIYCIWGEFHINREKLRNGVRFSMPECPNALAWTVTTENSGQNIIIHCTINKMSHDKDFVQSLEEFASAWETGIKQHYSSSEL